MSDIQVRYDSSPKGRARHARYRNSEKGRASRRRDNASASKRVRDLRYRQHIRAIEKYERVRQLMTDLNLAKETA